MSDSIEVLLDAVRQRFVQLEHATYYRESLIAHLSSLARDPLAPTDDPGPGAISFPDRIDVAFAVCRCGIQEFIVEGSTQECQTCGSLMFRTETAEYAIVSDGSP